MQNQNLPAVFNLGQLPSFLQNATPDSSMGSFGDSFGIRRVQLKGGQVNFLAEDKQHMGIVADEHGTVAFPQYSDRANIIILAIAPEGNTNYRAYYDSAYTEGDSAPPACWSADGVHPNPNAVRPQCTTCAACPQNVQGTSKTGKGRACQSRKRLAVVFANDPALRVFAMDLSGTALFQKSAREKEGYYALADYARTLKQWNTSWSAVVTETCFSEGSTVGVRFKAVGYVTEEQYTNIMAMRDSVEVQEALKIDFPKPKDETPATQAAPDPKALMLANPAFQTTLAHLYEWAQHPSITAVMLRDEAAKYGVAL